MSTRAILFEKRGPVAIITLNRPECRNALSRALLAELRDVIEKVDVDASTRAVVLTGAGTVFSAGMDLKEAAEMHRTPEGEHAMVAVSKEFSDLLERLHALSKPVIAALNGHALAGGAGLMTACDLAIASDGANIGYPEVQRGLVAAIVMHDLTRLVGDRRVRQLLLTGLPVSSTVAREWGLVNAVVPAERCLDEAVEWARTFTACAPGAMATTKRLLDEAQGRPANLRGAAAVSAAVRASDEAHEGMVAFLEKRPPQWSVKE